MIRQSKISAETVEAEVVAERGELLAKVSVRYRAGGLKNMAVMVAVAVATDEAEYHEPDRNLNAYVLDRVQVGEDHGMIHEHFTVAVPITR